MVLAISSAFSTPDPMSPAPVAVIAPDTLPPPMIAPLRLMPALSVSAAEGPTISTLLPALIDTAFVRVSETMVEGELQRSSSPDEPKKFNVAALLTS